MLFHSSLLLWTVIQVRISGSLAKPHATQSEDCGGDYISRSGTIRHPMNGKSYQNNENCVWTITTGEPINITFVSFDIENIFDILYISNGNSIDSRVLGNFSGSSLPSPVEEKTGAASIFFSSDHSVTLTGFILEWETLEPTTVQPTTTEVIDPPTTQPPPTTTTTTTTDSPDPLTTPTTTTEVTDPEPTQPPCEWGGNYTSRSGTIRHPMNDSSYQNNENCVWTITTEEPINITFVSFDIEGGYDYLIIRDGNSNDSRMLGNYTGSSLPSPVEANLGAAYLLFTSDSSVTDTGFVLQWETLDPLTTPTPTITVTDPLTTQTTTPEVTYPDPAQPSSRPPTCTDISPNCAINALPFQCNNNAYVQERCQKSCNLC